ncbi:MAG: PDZ domain-containing protein [Chloroflexota bacterium]
MQPTVTYTIAMPEPHTHLYHVTIEVTDVDGPTLTVALPVWTPGSYLIREYPRHIQEFSATNISGQSLKWQKSDKGTWIVEVGSSRRVGISYKVYANELTVRTSHLDGTHGYFNPATLCMYIPERMHETLLVQVLTPEGWHISTGLPACHDCVADIPSTRQFVFIASDYDELVDSPFECGTHRQLTFDVESIPHTIALWGRGNEEEEWLIEDTRKIVEVARTMFGGLPYDQYTFIVHLSNKRGGGLEHRNSVSMLVDRWTFQPRDAYERYLALTAHEFFHVWNVKRIRPANLGPFDYSYENYTHELWTMEGITTYYTDVLLHRAGFMSTERYLERLANQILTLQNQPGRHLQSLEQSSFDTWIKLYRPNEHSSNSSISYYLKGALVALLLDLEIRHHTNGMRSLDDVMRYLYASYPADKPGFPEQSGFRDAVETVGTLNGRKMYDGFFEQYIAGTDELDYETAFRYAGLQMIWGYTPPLRRTGLPPWLGINTQTQQGRLRVISVRSDGPASLASIYANDELIALDGFRVNEQSLNERLAERQPGQEVVLSLFRRDELLHIPVTLRTAPPNTLSIVPIDQPNRTQRTIYESWLGQNVRVAHESTIRETDA